MADRCYITKKDMAYKNILADMKLNEKPIFVISIETTGLDKFSDEIIKIQALKCSFNDKILSVDDSFERLIKNTKPLSAELEKITGITNEMLSNCSDISTIMSEFSTYIGEKPNIVGFNLHKFIIPMLNYAGFNSGCMIDFADCFDLMEVSTSCIESDKRSLDALTAKIIGIGKRTPKIDKTLALFNYISESLPTGTEDTTVSGTRFWSKGYKCRYIYVETAHGEIGLNCNTGFWIERVPGYFDTVNIDHLTEYVCRKTNCSNIWEFIKKFGK